MMDSISAADAKRRFSELLRTVKAGRTVVVTSHGKPVAKVVPIEGEERVVKGARVALFARLRSQKAANIGRWTRDELYDEP